MAKVFLSIGAGPGIGFSTARRFAREGYSVVLAARRPERLESYASQIAALGAKVEVRKADAADPKAIASLVTSLGNDLEVVHYNASVLHYDGARLLTRPIDTESIDTIVSDMNVNVTSVLTAIKSALPALRARGHGSLLVTGGGLAFAPSPDFFTLSVSKSGVRAATHALFEPLKAENIHIASVIVCRAVAAGSADVEAIANEFWRLHTQPRSEWAVESVYGNESGRGHN